MRCANQAARAVTEEIERHTKERLRMYDCMGITRTIGDALSKTAGFSPEWKDLLNEEYRPEPETANNKADPRP